MDKHVKIVSMVLLVFISFSCKKSNQHKQIKEPEVKPLATARGTMDGTPFQKTIGPAGGTLEVPNSTIPAGAVDKEMPFSVQAISNTLGKNGLGPSYRLLPCWSIRKYKYC